MNKLILGSIALAVLVGAGSAIAADIPVKAPPPPPDHWSWWVKPSVSAGYASFGDPGISFQTKGLALAGVSSINWKLPTMSGYFVGGELPIAFTDRFKLTIGGRWMSSDGKEATETFNGGTAIRRLWDTDKREWATAQALLSYAVVKNVGTAKEIAAVVGFRWDRHKINFRNVHNAAGVLTAAGDTVDFEMNTYAPVLGIAATFEGYRSGAFGGPIKVGAEFSPAVWGNIDYRETFGITTTMQFDGNLSRGTSFTANAEVTLLSAQVAAGARGSLALVGQYTRFFTKGDVQGTVVGIGPGQQPFEFTAHPNVATIGVKGAIAFGGH